MPKRRRKKRKLPVLVREDRLVFRTSYARVKAWALLDALEVPLIAGSATVIHTGSNAETLRAALSPWFRVRISKKKEAPFDDEVPF